MHKKLLPILLVSALILAGFISLKSISSIQGNARVVNYTGVVRGATQMLVKQELAGITNDELIARLDAIIENLETGEGSFDLIYLDDQKYQDQLQKVDQLYKQIKTEIYAVREGAPATTLYELSEQAFKETDLAVGLAETYTETIVQIIRLHLIFLIGLCLIVAAFVAFFSSRISKRQKEIKKTEEENKKKSAYLSLMAEELQAPMNEISELLYVSDIETNELLFLNKAGQQSFQLSTFYGQKCYEALQHRNAPCPFCTNDKLKDGEIISWEFTNPITQRHYLLKDRLIMWENHKARMEIAFDITDTVNEKKQLEYMLKAEETIVHCIHFLYGNLDVEQGVREVLKAFGEFLDADRTYVIGFQNNTMFKQLEWCKKGVSNHENVLRDVPLSAIEKWIKAFQEHGCYIIHDVEKLKEESPIEYEELKKYNIRHLIIAPIETDGEIRGYIGVDNPPIEHLQNIRSLLQTLNYFISLSYQRDLMEKQLSQMSYHDMLTGFYNRNRYMEDLEKIKQEHQTLGIAYIDINGLKEINDTYGHDRGDEAIQRAASFMKVHFPHDPLYRIGGDEFVVFVIGKSEAAFQSCIEHFQKAVEPDELLNVAIGAHWSKDSSHIQKDIALADAMMYENKREYYEKHRNTSRYRYYDQEESLPK